MPLLIEGLNGKNVTKLSLARGNEAALTGILIGERERERGNMMKRGGGGRREVEEEDEER